MAGIVHYRHGATVERVEKVLRDLPEGQKYIVIIYDGSMVPKQYRQASWVSNGPDNDVKAICKAIGDA